MCSGLIIEALTGCLSGQPAQQVATKEVTETADDEYSIIGKWSGKDSDNTVHYEFKEDGTYISSKTNAKGEKSDEEKGSYSFSEGFMIASMDAMQAWRNPFSSSAATPLIVVPAGDVT